MCIERKDSFRAERVTQPFVLWFTGLSGSGKSTLAGRVYDYLKAKELKVERLDGDTVRAIFPEMGFSKEERDAHVKRIGYLASILERNGVIVISSLISPYREARAFARGLCRNFKEVYVNASLDACEQRDVKGLYKKARAGEIKNFTGIDDPYEPPENAEIVITTDHQTEEQSFEELRNQVDQYLKG